MATSGANQEGIDLIGARDGDPDQPVSVQCKFKKRQHRLSIAGAKADPARMKAAADLLAAHPGSGVAQRFAAEAILEEAFSARSYDLPPVQGRERRASIELLQSHGDQMRPYENADQDVWAGVGVNLVTAYRSLHRRGDARRVSDQMLAVAPDLPNALIAAAHLDLMDDQLAKALERLDGLLDSPSRTLVMLAMAETPDWPGVVAVATPERRLAVREEDVRFFDTLVARGRIETKAANAEAALRALVAAWPGDPTVLAGAAQVARIHAPELAKELVRELLSGLRAETPHSARAMVAEVALALEGEDMRANSHTPSALPTAATSGSCRCIPASSSRRSACRPRSA